MDSTIRIGWIPALIIGAALAFAGWAVGRGVEHFRMGDRAVTVKGLAELDVKSDFAIWTLAFRRGGDKFSEVQRDLHMDRDRIVLFLRNQGFEAGEIEVHPLQVQDLLTREWASRDVGLRFNGQGRVLVKTPRVDVVAQVVNRVDPLIQAGIQLESEQQGQPGLRYQLRGFNDVKPKLLEEATRNARTQAAKFAEDAGATLGRLKNANQGVIRVLDSDGGEEDSGRTIDKRLRVVSTFQYALD
ncbi:SIMPL domain-containing protein [Azotobacter armeniacus]